MKPRKILEDIENAIKLAQKKIVFVLKQDGVKLSGGAGEYLWITFSRWYLKGLERYFDEKMIEIRKDIAEKRNSKYAKTVLKGAAIVGGLGLFGRFFYKLGSNKRGT